MKKHFSMLTATIFELLLVMILLGSSVLAIGIGDAESFVNSFTADANILEKLEVTDTNEITVYKDIMLNDEHYEITGDLVIKFAENVETEPTITVAANKRITVIENGNLTFTGKGTVKAPTVPSNNGFLYVGNDESSEGAHPSLTISNGTTVISENSHAVFVLSGDLIVDGGNIKAKLYPISNNGSESIGYKVTVKDGLIESTGATGIFNPANVTVEISGGTIRGVSGIEMRDGTLKISGNPTIECLNPNADQMVLNTVTRGSGNSVIGAGIAISPHLSSSSAQRKVNVQISGGTIKGVSALYAVDLHNSNTPVTINVEGGTFIGGKSSSVFIKEKFDNISSDVQLINSQFINGGTFNNPIPDSLRTSNCIFVSVEEIEDSTLYTYYTEESLNTNSVDKKIYKALSDGTPDLDTPISYALTITPSSNGVVSASKTYFIENESVLLDITPETGYELDSVVVTRDDNSEVISNDISFKMPNSDVTITTTFKERPVPPEPDNEKVKDEDINPGNEKVEDVTSSVIKSNGDITNGTLEGTYKNVADPEKEQVKAVKYEDKSVNLTNEGEKELIVADSVEKISIVNDNNEIIEYVFVGWENEEGQLVTDARPLPFADDGSTIYSPVYRKSTDESISIPGAVSVVDKTDQKSGTVIGDGNYLPKTPVIVVAIENEGFTFYQWKSNMNTLQALDITRSLLPYPVSKDNPYGFIAENNIQIEAEFKANNSNSNGPTGSGSGNSTNNSSKPETDKPATPNKPGTPNQPSTSKPVQQTTVYRVYNAMSGEHLFTTDRNEYTTLISMGWNDEGTGWHSPKSGTPVYRLYSPVTGEHLYTIDTNEVNVLTTAGTWSLDNNGNAIFYSGGSKPIYRSYHSGVKMHHLTVDLNEHSTITFNGWNDEGVAFYAN